MPISTLTLVEMPFGTSRWIMSIKRVHFFFSLFLCFSRSLCLSLFLPVIGLSHYYRSVALDEKSHTAFKQVALIEMNSTIIVININKLHICLLNILAFNFSSSLPREVSNLCTPRWGKTQRKMTQQFE